jgi:hypothetical protein
MRRTDETPLDPEILAQLDAIDATLAGDPVDPAYADIAELSLLLAAEKPEVRPEFARSMDQLVQRRFTRPAESGVSPRRWRRVRQAWYGPLAGLAAGAAAIAVVAVIASSGGGGGTPSGISAPVSTAASSSASSGSVAAKAPAPAHRLAPSRAATVPAASGSVASSSAASTAGSAQSANGTATPSAAEAPRPAPNARKIIQSATLALSAAGNRIDAVSQELFNVVGRENGYVNNSQVTSGAGGYAQFQLSVPSSALQDTMTALSQLQYATVVSRTDATQDVNGQYLYDQRKLADDRALRTSLLKQLANAVTQAQIDSLTARIHDAEASINSDQATLRGLTHRIDYSQVTVTINSAAPVPVKHHHTGGFTLGKAAHDAGRVLTVGAGVALIALAALLPIALIAALIWWIASAARRRRREHALDLA